MGQRQTAKPEPRQPPGEAKAKKQEFLSEEDESCVDQASEDSFPASDPPSYTPVTHSGKPKRGPVKQKHRH